MYVSALPIPAAPPEKQKAVEHLVDCILAAKARDAGADVSALEREIASQPRRMSPRKKTVAGATGGDQLLYALYPPAPRLRRAGGLTPEEIKIVEGAAK